MKAVPVNGVDVLLNLLQEIEQEARNAHVNAINEYGDGTVNGLNIARDMIKRELQVIADVNLMVSM